MAEVPLSAKALLLGLGLVVVAGAVVSMVPGLVQDRSVFSAGPTQPDGGPSGRVDYNCGGPGWGEPWLEHLYFGDQDDVAIWRDPAFMAGVFSAEDGHQLALPVVVGADGRPRSMDDVYRILCRVHPELGGSGLRLMTWQELVDKTDLSDYPPGLVLEDPDAVNDVGLYTDDVPRARDEAHLGWETIRVYLLPQLPSGLLQKLVCSSDAEECESSPEQQRWHVALTGYEIDEMDRYWEQTTRVRGAIRFDYRLEADFTLRKEADFWVFAEGSIISSEVRLTSLFLPVESWELRPLECRGCDRLSVGGTLRGTVDGDGVRLRWGNVRPEVNVGARVVATCTPMPGCAEWMDRLFVSENFLDRAGDETLSLRDGFAKQHTVTSPQGVVWVFFRYTLTRLDAG